MFAFTHRVFRSRHSIDCRDPNAPLAESAYARVSETRCSGFESRVGHQIFCVSESSRRSFTTWMWQTTPAARNVPSVGLWAARRGGGLSPATTFPSSNGQDRGPSSRVCRFESGREYQRFLSLAVAQPGQRASFGTRRPQVRILPARPINTSVITWRRNSETECLLVEQEVAGSSPAGAANTEVPRGFWRGGPSFGA